MSTNADTPDCALALLAQRALAGRVPRHEYKRVLSAIAKLAEALKAGAILEEAETTLRSIRDSERKQMTFAEFLADQAPSPLAEEEAA